MFDFLTVDFFVQVLVLGIPVLLAVTLHEAAHGYVALHYGDQTALRAGRISLNPLRHVDPFGTVILPGILILSGSPFLFGYAKPVPVNFNNLRNPRQDMVSVAIAGPLTNIFLALVSAMAFHLLPFFSEAWAAPIAQGLKMSLILNVTLALFNMIPLPPLDGGRVAVGLLPDILAEPLAKLERFGMIILFSMLIIVPYVTHKMGNTISPFSWLLEKPIEYVVQIIATVTGVL